MTILNGRVLKLGKKIDNLMNPYNGVSVEKSVVSPSPQGFKILRGVPPIGYSRQKVTGGISLQGRSSQTIGYTSHITELRTKVRLNMSIENQRITIQTLLITSHIAKICSHAHYIVQQ